MARVKELSVVLAVAAFLGPVEARADLAMKIIRQTYHASGYAEADAYYDDYGVYHAENPEWPEGVYAGWSESYDVTTSHPPAQGGIEALRAGSTVRWTDSYSTGDYVVSDGAYFSCGAGGPRQGPGGGPPFLQGVYWEARASLSLDFMLAGPDDSLHALAFAPGPYDNPGATLVDLVTGDSWTLVGSGMGRFEYDYESGPHPIPIDTDHVYRLTMYNEDTYMAGGGTVTAGFYNVSRVSVVPLPGAALLGLLGMGTASWNLRNMRR